MRDVAKLERRDLDAVRGLRAQILRYDDSPVLDLVTAELRPLLGAEIGCAYRIGLATDAWSLDFVHSSGAGPRFAPLLHGYAARTPLEGPFPSYDALNPPRQQRNVALVVTPAFMRETLETHPFNEHFLRPQRLERHDHLRALVCDGSLLLGWVGVLGTTGFGMREKRLLNAIVAPLRTRLRLEQRLRDADIHKAGFDAALDAMDAAVFLVRDAHVVLHANAAGRALLDSRRVDVRARIAAARAGTESGATVVPLATRGLTRHCLVVLATPHPSIDARVALAARLWRLTPRQRDVLRLVARGESNKTVAERLRCSLVTAEVHVSALLRKAGATSRTAVVAKLWAL